MTLKKIGDFLKARASDLLLLAAICILSLIAYYYDFSGTKDGAFEKMNAYIELPSEDNKKRMLEALKECFKDNECNNAIYVSNIYKDDLFSTIVKQASPEADLSAARFFADEMLPSMHYAYYSKTRNQFLLSYHGANSYLLYRKAIVQISLGKYKSAHETLLGIFKDSSTQDKAVIGFSVRNIFNHLGCTDESLVWGEFSDGVGDLIVGVDHYPAIPRSLSDDALIEKRIALRKNTFPEVSLTCPLSKSE
jgi:hypothetical protein